MELKFESRLKRILDSTNLKNVEKSRILSTFSNLELQERILDFLMDNLSSIDLNVIAEPVPRTFEPNKQVEVFRLEKLQCRDEINNFIDTLVKEGHGKYDIIKIINSLLKLGLVNFIYAEKAIGVYEAILGGILLNKIDFSKKEKLISDLVRRLLLKDFSIEEDNVVIVCKELIRKNVLHDLINVVVIEKLFNLCTDYENDNKSVERGETTKNEGDTFITPPTSIISADINEDDSKTIQEKERQARNSIIQGANLNMFDIEQQGGDIEVEDQSKLTTVDKLQALIVEADLDKEQEERLQRMAESLNHQYNAINFFLKSLTALDFITLKERTHLGTEVFLEVDTYAFLNGLECKERILSYIQESNNRLESESVVYSTIRNFVYSKFHLLGRINSVDTLVSKLYSEIRCENATPKMVRSNLITNLLINLLLSEGKELDKRFIKFNSVFPKHRLYINVIKVLVIFEATLGSGLDDRVSN